MLISGVQKFTMLDFPDKVACIVFTPFCNFRCGYCYNSDFVLPEKIEKIKHIFIPEEIFLNFLKTRIGLIDGVVITGGEPTLQKDLVDFVNKIKTLGFLVKLDTNGTNPEILKELVDLDLVDYIAMDIKGPFEKYKDIISIDFDINKIKESFEFIKNCGIDYEFRTTVVKEQLTKEDLLKIGEYLSGVKKYYLQSFKNRVETLDKEFDKKTSYFDLELEEVCKIISIKFDIKMCKLR